MLARWFLPSTASTFWLAIVLAGPALLPAVAGDAPGWMRALTSAPLPDHDETTDAVLLYSETILVVQGSGKIKRTTREVYKILRVGGKEYGMVLADFDDESKILSMHGWCISTSGRDYAVKESDAVETSLRGVANGELFRDIRTKVLQIPAADPGNIVGYEIEQEEHPYVLQDVWMFQTSVPTREARYTLQLPAGWEYKAVWLNATGVQPVVSGKNQWQWTVSGVKAMRAEVDMPPRRGIAGQMLVSLLPPAESNRKGFETWAEMGKWEANLAQGRRDPSPEIKRKVAELTANSATTLAKMQALGGFVQHDIRYVAIELGIGGWQPHPAKDIFAHGYGDCKDKATLMSSMLKEIGVDSYYISINTIRGAVNAQTPPQMFLFNHEILGIRLPDDVKDANLIATFIHPALGRILAFDPTDEMTPLGHLSGALQANYGLLVTPLGGDLVELPQLSPSLNGIHRSAKLVLTPSGTLSGEMTDMYWGDNANYERHALEVVPKDKRRELVESMLSKSLSKFEITKLSHTNLSINDGPFAYVYTFTAQQYAKPAGNLMLVRPRVLGNKSSDILETGGPRNCAVEFEGPQSDHDSFEITLPEGYVVDELPPAADIDYSFASYHSKTEAQGKTLKYKRSFEIKELTVPVSKLDELKAFYRMIASDERNVAVLKVVGP